ncbi:MAG: heme-binding protein [Wenyingzhuangia sp.]
MKVVLILISIVFITFIAIQIYALKTQSSIETYSYEVHQKYKTFEIRIYEETLFTSVKLSTSGYKDSSSKGFSILAGYIFGGNERNEKISMTSPVAMTLTDSMTMMFMVPKEFSKETLPKPNQSSITFKKEPKKIVAALHFSGWANDKKIEDAKQKLKSALDQEGIAYSNRFCFLGYNAPYEVFNRRNEIIVELK